MPERRCASAYQARSFRAGAATPTRNADSGRAGVRRASSRWASTSSATSRATFRGSKRITRAAICGLSERRSSTFCSAYAPVTLPCTRTMAAARSAGGGVCIRELQVRDHLLKRSALLLRQKRHERAQRLDRKLRVGEISRLRRELPVGKRGEHRGRVDEQVRDLDLLQLCDKLLCGRFS